MNPDLKHQRQTLLQYAAIAAYLTASLGYLLEEDHTLSEIEPGINRVRALSLHNDIGLNNPEALAQSDIKEIVYVPMNEPYYGQIATNPMNQRAWILVLGHHDHIPDVTFYWITEMISTYQRPEGAIKKHDTA